MSLTPGTRFGAYEVGGAIGAGGMGEVYQATDTRLKRQVALKILAPSLVADDRLARLQREAEVLASLNHPHIAAIYGLEDVDGVKALVMEFVPGEDLSRHIARGSLALEDTLSIARQIADALEAAHDLGIVHRDLKPANIKVRDDGTVKVLDFGLAKMLDPATVAPGVSLPPTITSPVNTQLGSILGTAAYMSPEQARGKAADKRSDVWAFGCVLYEMVTGTRPFDADEITDVLAAVVRDEPDWQRLPASTPASIRRLLRRTLTKDRRRRLADMSDARLELDDTSSEPAVLVSPATTPPRSIRAVPWLIAAAAVVAALAAFAARGAPASAPDLRVARFSVASPSGSIELGQPISPDGRTLAFITRAEGTSHVWVRPLDSAVARMLPETEGATRSFWSPDSQHVAFIVEGNLMAAAVDGSGTRLITRGPFRDGAWTAGGVILVGGQRGRPLMRVLDRGGDAVAETALDASVQELSHDYPEFLPDGRHYIFLSRRGSGAGAEDFVSYVGVLGSSERRPLPGIRSAAKYSPSGHVLFIRGTTLLAQAFDATRLELSGEPFPVAEDAAGNRVAAFSVSTNGSLAVIGGVSSESRLSWVDRTGKPLGSAGPDAIYRNALLSRDGRMFAFDRGTPSDVWVLNLERGSASKVTSDSSDDSAPVWSPDGQTLVFASNRGGANGLYERAIGVVAVDRLLLRTDTPVVPTDWAPDGKHVIYTAAGDQWALPLTGDRTPVRLTESPLFLEIGGTLSPDSRWLAYQSNESTGITRAGDGDVFVRSFPQPGFTQQVSSGGGFAPRWSTTGGELFYLTPGGTVMSVALTSRGTTLEFGPPKTLFPLRPDGLPLNRSRYDVADGRFLVREGTVDLSITVVLNWFEKLRRDGLLR